MSRRPRQALSLHLFDLAEMTLYTGLIFLRCKTIPICR